MAPSCEAILTGEVAELGTAAACLVGIGALAAVLVRAVHDARGDKGRR